MTRSFTKCGEISCNVSMEDAQLWTIPCAHSHVRGLFQLLTENQH
jgi:hypothetical protein